MLTKKTKDRANIWPTNPTPRHISWENHNSKACMHPTVLCSTIYNSQDMEATQMSIDRGTDKEDVVHKYNAILLSHNREWNSAICRDVDGPRDCHRGWSKSEREKQISYNIASMWNLKKWYRWTYWLRRNRVTDVENSLMVTKRGRGARIVRLGLIYIYYYV